MIYSLYQYTHKESGKKYIGMTNNLTRRVYEHTNGKSGAPAFARAVKKYGIPSFDFKVLAIFDRVEAACYHEQAAILKFNTLSPYGYNCIAGAPYTQYRGPSSDETKAKIAAAITGRRPSSETRAKISATLLGCSSYTRSADTNAKMSAIMMGHPCSDETRAKLSVARRKRPPASETTRAKCSVASKKRWSAQASRFDKEG